MDQRELPDVVTGPLDRHRALALDAVAALAYTAFAIVLASSRHPFHGAPSRAWPWPDCAVLATVGLPVAVRRLKPVAVLAIVTAASIGALALQVLHDPFTASAYCLYIVAAQQPRRRWLPAGAITGAGLVAVVAATVLGASPAATGSWVGTPLLGIALLAGSWTAGRAVRARRLDAERAAAVQAAQAVAEERLRMARELHDVVAHSMSLIAVKAGVARYVARERPREASDALTVIEQASRTALEDMRAMLDVLRAGSGASEPFAPAPGAAELPGLAARVRDAGVHVDLNLAGVDHLPEGVALAVYRIVQESLTNVVKHAAPTDCRVTVHADEHSVVIHVTDSGPHDGVPGRTEPPAHGRGIVGMRERAALYGGYVTAGNRTEGGFEVQAQLWYGDERRRGQR